MQHKFTHIQPINTHTWTHTCITTHEKASTHYYAYLLAEMWYSQVVLFSEGPAADAEPHRQLNTHPRVYCICVCMWVCRCVGVCISVQRCCWIIHLWLQVVTSKLSTRWEREEREREREVRVGGLEGETKTKIEDEQWWEGQRRSDRWLSDSSVSTNNAKHILCLSDCLSAGPQSSVCLLAMIHDQLTGTVKLYFCYIFRTSFWLMPFNLVCHLLVVLTVAQVHCHS